MLSLEQLAKLPKRLARWNVELYAVQFIVPLEILDVVAVMDRESGGRNILGDIRGGVAHGWGLMQLDISSYPWLPTTQLKDGSLLALDPMTNIRIGAGQLASNLHVAARVRPDEPLPIMFASFNASMERVLKAADLLTGDELIKAVDSVTTNMNYSSDCLRRRSEFAASIGVEIK